MINNQSSPRPGSLRGGLIQTVGDPVPSVPSAGAPAAEDNADLPMLQEGPYCGVEDAPPEPALHNPMAVDSASLSQGPTEAQHFSMSGPSAYDILPPLSDTAEVAPGDSSRFARLVNYVS